MENIIIIRLQGGLGNQLFQYAFGAYLSKSNGAKVYLDKYLLENSNIQDTPRAFELGAYKLSSAVLTEYDRKRLKVIKPGRITNFLSNHGFSFQDVKYINERKFTKQEKSSSLGSILVAHGFWQKLSYVTEVNGVIKDVLYSYDATNENVVRILDRVISCNSVSLHVRRGDYISNLNAAKFHALCGMRYFSEAIEKIKSRISDPVFYIFSDDPAWVESEFKTIEAKYEIVSSKNKLNHHDELYIMAHCKHNIIANSSFSWWGAWANNNPKKIVIAPLVWHKSSKVPPADFIPPEWLLI